jgi:hypothetical protein
MTVNASHKVTDEPLGEAAPNRGPLDLLAEAGRLKFTEVEIAELKRLYAVDKKTDEGKTPQT